MRFHYFALARTFIVYSTKMQKAVNYNAVKFSRIISAYRLGVTGHGVKRNEHIAAHSAPVSIVKGDYVGEIVVIEKLTVYLDDFVITAENVG